MDNVWAPVAAALGASLLTTVGLLARDWWMDREANVRARLDAYREVLVQSMMVVQLATGLRMTAKIRSGIRDGLDIALHHRKPLEPLELSNRVAEALQPLFSAQSAVWATGTQQGITLANSVVERCMDLLSGSGDEGKDGTRIKRLFAGKQWTREQEATFSEANVAIGVARKDLADLLREEGKMEEVDVFSRGRAVG